MCREGETVAANAADHPPSPAPHHRAAQPTTRTLKDDWNPGREYGGHCRERFPPCRAGRPFVSENRPATLPVEILMQTTVAAGLECPPARWISQSCIKERKNADWQERRSPGRLHPNPAPFPVGVCFENQAGSGFSGRARMILNASQKKNVVLSVDGPPKKSEQTERLKVSLLSDSVCLAVQRSGAICRGVLVG